MSDKGEWQKLVDIFESAVDPVELYETYLRNVGPITELNPNQPIVLLNWLTAICTIAPEIKKLQDEIARLENIAQRVPPNQRYYIDWQKKERECCECRVIKPFKKYSPTKNKSGNFRPQSKCKECRATYEVRKRLEKVRKRLERRAELNPNMYLDCDHCDHVWHKRYGADCTKCGEPSET